MLCGGVWMDGGFALFAVVSCSLQGQDAARFRSCRGSMQDSGLLSFLPPSTPLLALLAAELPLAPTSVSGYIHGLRGSTHAS